MMVDRVNFVPGVEGVDGVVRPRDAEKVAKRVGEVERLRVEGRRYALRWTRCGKPTCRSCPHGPYWYQVIRSSGKEAYKYVGKDLIGHLNLVRTRAWLKALGERELPGMPVPKIDLPRERPSWLPEDDWKRLQRAFAEKVQDQASSDASAGGEETAPGVVDMFEEPEAGGGEPEEEKKGEGPEGGPAIEAA